jgi:RNA polymerase sigma-70 factor (ECF subfamily)
VSASSSLLLAVEDEPALITRAQQGDVEAFAELYDRHAPQVLAIARRALGNAADADDLLHDVFLEAWQGVRAYDPARASFRTWLCVRARSRALDRLGRRRRELQVERQLSQIAAPCAASAAAERSLTTRSALAHLPAPLRLAVELTYLLGMTAPEIAAHTGLAEGTVRSRLARGLCELERALR